MNVARAGAIYALANFASAGVPFLLLPILTRILTPEDYGFVVSFAMIMTLCGSVAGLSAHAAVGVAWFKRPRDELQLFVGSALAVATVSTLGVAGLMAVFLWAYPSMGAHIGAGWGALAAIAAGANVIWQCRLVLWQSQQRPVPYALLQFGASVFNVSLSLVAVLALGLGAAGRNGGIVIAFCLMAVAAVWHLVRADEARFATDRANARSILAFGVPLIPHALAGVLLATADRWMVSVQLGGAALGVYGAVAQLGMVMAILSDAFGKAFNPWLYAKLSADGEEGRQRAVGAIYTAIPLLIVVAAVVGIVVYVAAGFLLGEAYQDARGLLHWFIIGGACTGIYLCASGLYFFSGRLGRLALVSMSVTGVGTLITWQLIGMQGVAGAAIGYAATQALLALATLVVAMITFELPWRHPLRAFAGSRT
jgi:O-antigen/teichoic acid export membrane protein